MRCEFVNVALHSIKETLGSLSPDSSQIEIKRVFIRENELTEKPVVIKNDFAGGVQGLFTLSMDMPTAIGLADYLLTGGDFAEGFTELVQSSLKEIVNIITGRMSTLLAENRSEIKIFLPQLSFANYVEVSTVQCPTPISLQLVLSAGEVDLDIALSD